MSLLGLMVDLAFACASTIWNLQERRLRSVFHVATFAARSVFSTILDLLFFRQWHRLVDLQSVLIEQIFFFPSIVFFVSIFVVYVPLRSCLILEGLAIRKMRNSTKGCGIYLYFPFLTNFGHISSYRKPSPNYITIFH